MSNSVNTSGIYDLSGQMEIDIANIKKFINECSETCEEIKTKIKFFKTFNGCEVSNSRGTYTGPDGIYEYYSKWNITSTETFINYSNELINKLSCLLQPLDKFSTEILKNYSIADEIDGYIEIIQKELEGYEIDTSQLSKNFDYLKSGIAYDDIGAANGNFISSNNILTEYWIDKTLKFVKQDNGTYMVMQADENGNMVAMGFVTAGTVATYLNNLSADVKPKEEIDNSIKEETSDTTENVSTVTIEQSNSKTIYDIDVSKEVYDEIIEYKSRIIPSNKNKLSSLASEIIDNKVQIIEKTAEDYVDNRDTIYIKDGMDVPEPKEGEYTYGDKYVYDSNDSKYHKYTKSKDAGSVYKKTGDSYTLSEMSKMEFK